MNILLANKSNKKQTLVYINRKYLHNVANNSYNPRLIFNFLYIWW